MFVPHSLLPGGVGTLGIGVGVPWELELEYPRNWSWSTLGIGVGVPWELELQYSKIRKECLESGACGCRKCGWSTSEAEMMSNVGSGVGYVVEGVEQRENRAGGWYDIVDENTFR